MAHDHRGHRPTNATPEGIAADMVQLAHTRYSGVNHTHLAELLAEREGIHIGRTTLRREDDDQQSATSRTGTIATLPTVTCTNETASSFCADLHKKSAKK